MSFDLSDFDEQESMDARVPEVKEPSGFSRTGAFTRGFAQELLWGGSDEVEAWFKSFFDGTEEEQQDIARRLNEIAKSEQPGSYQAGEIVGMVLPTALMLATVVGKAGAAANVARIAGRFGWQGFRKASSKAAKEIIKKGKTDKAVRSVSKDLRKKLKKLGSDAPKSLNEKRKLQEQATRIVTGSKKKRVFKRDR